MKYTVPVRVNVVIYGVMVTAQDGEEAQRLAEQRVAERLRAHLPRITGAFAPNIRGTMKAGRAVEQVPVPRPGQPGMRRRRRRR